MKCYTNMIDTIICVVLNLAEVFFFPIYFFISWKLIILQYCSGFCHTLT